MGNWDKIASLYLLGCALGNEPNSRQKDYFKGVQVLSLGETFKKLPYVITKFGNLPLKVKGVPVSRSYPAGACS